MSLHIPLHQKPLLFRLFAGKECLAFRLNLPIIVYKWIVRSPASHIVPGPRLLGQGQCVSPSKAHLPLSTQLG